MHSLSHLGHRGSLAFPRRPRNPTMPHLSVELRLSYLCLPKRSGPLSAASMGNSRGDVHQVADIYFSLLQLPWSMMKLTGGLVTTGFGKPVGLHWPHSLIGHLCSSICQSSTSLFIFTIHELSVCNVYCNILGHGRWPGICSERAYHLSRTYISLLNEKRN